VFRGPELKPTAQTSFTDVADTPDRSLKLFPGLGLDTICHDWHHAGAVLVLVPTAEVGREPIGPPRPNALRAGLKLTTTPSTTASPRIIPATCLRRT
jgi:hypothetical protein